MLKYPTSSRKSPPPKAPHIPTIERPTRMPHIHPQPQPQQQRQAWSNPGQNVSDDFKERLLRLQMEVSAWKAIKK